MTLIHAFSADAATWQNFYLLVGTAAATLIGLMFVAVTFGAGLMTSQSTASARAFVDPPIALLHVQRRMREAHQKFGDIELSDWLMGVVLPLVCYLALIGTGGAFLVGWEAAFSALAVCVIAILLLGVFGAWELVLWLALTRVRAKDAA